MDIAQLAGDPESEKSKKGYRKGQNLREQKEGEEQVHIPAHTGSKEVGGHILHVVSSVADP
jgi:hypothetical protein